LAGKEKSRILAAAPYDKYLNAGRGVIMPAASDQGAWVMMQNQTNRRRVSKDGKRFYPAHVASMSRLRFGCLAAHEAAYDSLADFFFRDNAVELRIPWGLINFTDPSSKSILWKGKDSLVKKTAGVRLIAVSYKPAPDGLTALSTGLTANHTDCFPSDWRDDQVKVYSWQDWNTPIYHTYLKRAAIITAASLPSCRRHHEDYEKRFFEAQQRRAPLPCASQRGNSGHCPHPRADVP
jgi:hypothetical protein